MIPLTPKEVVIRMARRILGENRVHDYLIRRGIELRHLKDAYEEHHEISERHNVADQRENGERHANQQTLIFMADGKWMHGGLTDRLRGMTSAYKFAKEHGLDFKIFHTSPFLLQEILQPNKVDWIIDEKELSHDSSVAKPVLLYREDFDNDSALERQLDASHEQFHLYSCIDTVGEDFPKYFSELFKPAPLLAQELSNYDKLLGSGYTAISFRFQNKLGDFKEFTFKELPEAGKRELLDAALEMLETDPGTGSGMTIHGDKGSGMTIHGDKGAGMTVQGDKASEATATKCLVTADSPTFLAEVEKMPNAVTVKGKSIHIDFNSSKKATDYLKAFTEFFLISRASKAILYRNRKYKTYPSNFPKYAAMLGNVPYEIVEK
ncbi:MAG: hypothetical protein J6W51_05910 [Fibrobacter sp.]|nr:hypothetical protein [Fibrobacter sp.]